MQTINVGKAKIRIEVEGCTKCGTRYSSGWSVERVVNVVVEGRRSIKIEVHVCADCGRPKKGHRK